MELFLFKIQPFLISNWLSLLPQQLEIDAVKVRMPIECRGEKHGKLRKSLC